MGIKLFTILSSHRLECCQFNVTRTSNSKFNVEDADYTTDLKCVESTLKMHHGAKVENLSILNDLES